MENRAGSRSLTSIVTAVATRLMGATASTATDISTEILAELVEILDVDVSFLRYNDHNIHATVLVAEWPQRPDKPDPDPLQTIYFADADPDLRPVRKLQVASRVASRSREPGLPAHHLGRERRTGRVHGVRPAPVR